MKPSYILALIISVSTSIQCNEKNVLLLTFGLSGSNWLSYCTEQIFNIAVVPHNNNLSVFTSQINQKDAYKNIIVKKIHRPWLIKSDEQVDGLVVLVRNYKEVLCRMANLAAQSNNIDVKKIFDNKSLYNLLSNPTKKDIDLHNPLNIGGNLYAYMSILKYFDKYSGAKTILFYEDLIKNPKKELQKLKLFINSLDKNINSKLDSFINNIKDHKQKSLSLYPKNPGNTAGEKNKLKKHSEILSKAQKQEIDHFIKDTYESLFDKYLLKYSEK